MLFSLQGINRTLLAWMKLWDETVFGRSSLPRMSSRTGSAREGKGKGKGPGKPGSGAGAGGKKEWREYKDPATFASEEVSCMDVRDVPM